VISMAVIGCVWSLEWSNPYTAPRDGLPRVRAQVFFPMGHPNYGFGGCPAELKALHVPGDGWCISWGSVSTLPRKLSQETLASVRQQRLARRVAAKYPLLADQIVEEELARRPAYYAGVTDERIEAQRDETLRQQEAHLQPLLETPGVIHWYDKEA
jgi:hypothetical protein